MANATITETGGNTEITQYGVTLTFSGIGHTSGLFANGDAWIVRAPTQTLISTSPASTGSGSNTRNGLQVNPRDATESTQGYDGRGNVGYDNALNLDPGNTGSDLVISVDSSLMKAVSLANPDPNNRPKMETIVVVTVLGTAPPANAFRPPYMGTDKTIIGTVGDLDYSFLATEVPPPTTPALATVEAYHERVWIEQNGTYNARSIHPTLNMPDYGREVARESGNGLLSLNLNYSNAQKETLMIRMVQYGIDIYGAAADGMDWGADGGHNQGRKAPLLLAGKALNDPNILAYGDAAQHFIFQDDQQTFFVSQADVDLPRFTGDGRPRDPYTTEMIGTPEWGEKHSSNPSKDGSNWDAYYRHTASPLILAHMTAARLMGLEDEWNWAPASQYTDRYGGVEIPDRVGGSGPNSITGFEEDMYVLQQASNFPIQLNNATADTIDQTTATVGCSSDRSTGTQYLVITRSSEQPTPAQIMAGQDHTGAPADYSDNQLNPTSPQTYNATGLAANTNYNSHFYQADGGDESNTLTSSTWKTASAGGSSLEATFTFLAIHFAKTESNFPALVDLSEIPAGSWWDTVTPSGGDVRAFASDGSTGLPLEIIEINNVARTGKAWINVDSIAGGTDTDVLLRVDGTSAALPVTDPLGRNAVWSQSAAVFHCNGDGVDSSGNCTDLVLAGTGGSIESDHFATNGTDAWFEATMNSKVADVASSYRVQPEVEMVSASQMFAIRDDVDPGYMRWDVNRNFHQDQGGTTGNKFIDLGAVAGAGRLTIDWVWRLSGNSLHGYKEGVLQDSDNNSRAVGFEDGNTIKFMTFNVGQGSSDGKLFSGRVDTVPRDADWIAAEQANRDHVPVTSPFYTVSISPGTSIVLSGPVQSEVERTTAIIGCSTDTLAGELWVVTTQSATPPTAAQIKLGQDHTGAAAVFADSNTSPIAQTLFPGANYQAGETYYNHFYQENGADVSNVLSSGPWATLPNPVLSNPTQADITQTTATVGCTTDNPSNGTLYFSVTQSATPPSNDDLKNGVGAADFGNQTNPLLAQTFAVVGLTAGQTYYTHFLHETDPDGVSAILTSAAWMTLPEPSSITLTNATETSITQTTATIACNTDTAAGELWVVTTTSPTAPSAAQIKLGQDHTGAAATYAASDTTPTATTSFAATGFTASTGYYNYFYQENGADTSNVLESGVWQTLAAGPVLTNPTQTNITQNSATVGCSTNVLDGVLYAYISTSPTPPSTADLKLGTGAVWFGNKVPVTATTTFDATGLKAENTFYTYFYQEAPSGNSTILESGAWNTLDAMIPDNIAGIPIQECLLRTAGNSNVRLAGNVQVDGSDNLWIEVPGSGAEELLTWSGTEYTGEALVNALYVSFLVDQTVTVNFRWGDE